MPLREVSLDDKYVLEDGRIYLTGVQALVRLPLEQRRRDARAGLDTAGFISGYRGSPLGSYDQQLWRAAKHLAEHRIHFQPGINEDLAATAIWGSQQAALFDDARHQGVFAYWYGKGPGVDRSGDVFRHGNLAGSARHGGVLLIAGDDHGSRSSTLPHQSEQAFVAAGIPVLNPAGVAEILEFGIAGMEMSRFSGCWVALKATADNLDASASIDVRSGQPVIRTPELPGGGLNIRWPDHWMDQEARLHTGKLDAAKAFVRLNRLDRVVCDAPGAHLGIATTGKACLDTRQALETLGADAAGRVRLYKIGMSWPLEPQGLAAFAEGLEEILVVEEKRPLVETQVKEELYHLPPGRRPRVSGKTDPEGAPLLSSNGELESPAIARAIARRLDAVTGGMAFQDRLGAPAEATPEAPLARTPWFCPGCPHNTSTRVPEGSRATAGIGCHFMALWMDRDTSTYTHMGGEGASWIGQAPFVATNHVFTNLGDGTYTHSGLLAIRAAAASGVNITYKILFNDAVAMTGGQPADGGLTVPQIARQVAAEGAKAICIVTDEPGKYPAATQWPPGCRVHHRGGLDAVQRHLRDVPGLTVLIYDQTCAAEKRRRRKRGTLADPPQRVFINELVCEGCGDCGRASNCVSIMPVETEFGRKRRIDQSSCNKDTTCLDGFCPSFVTVTGGRPRVARPDVLPPESLPEPPAPTPSQPHSILVAGIGGTGVVTIGALLGMAAHLDGRGVSVLDMIGLAQKGGAVVSHVRIAATPEDLHAARIAEGAADLLLACDMVTAAAPENLARLSAGTTAIVNSEETMTGAFTLDPDLAFPAAPIRAALENAAGRCHTVDATRLARHLLGDSIAANLFLVGYAWQKGLVPVTRQALERAIELNGVAVEANLGALQWGRCAAHDMGAVSRLVPAPPQATFEDLTERRAAFLTDYQNHAWAARYRALVQRIADAEDERTPGRKDLRRAVARHAFKLMAAKDEYEVARLYTDGSFAASLQEAFEGNVRLSFHLAAPFVSRRDPATGHLVKRTYGPWILPLFRILAAMRRLRGTLLDPFRLTRDRREDRRLVADYFELMNEVAAGLTLENHEAAVALASIPDAIRGFGHIRHQSLAQARKAESQALHKFREAATPNASGDRLTAA